MKRKILVIHNGYPLRGDGGDKVRTLNMLQSLDSIGFDVCLLAFFKKDFSLLALNKKSMPSNIKSYFIFTLPDRWGHRLIRRQRQMCIRDRLGIRRDSGIVSGCNNLDYCKV